MTQAESSRPQGPHMTTVGGSPSIRTTSGAGYAGEGAPARGTGGWHEARSLEQALPAP